MFFATIDWEGNLRLLKSDFDGNNLKILYAEKTSFSNPMSDVDVNMVVVENGIYIAIANKISFYNFATNMLTDVYTTTGCVRDIRS